VSRHKSSERAANDDRLARHGFVHRRLLTMIGGQTTGMTS
jgi:hypothetical protein